MSLQRSSICIPCYTIHLSSTMFNRVQAVCLEAGRFVRNLLPLLVLSALAVGAQRCVIVEEFVWDG